MKIKPLKTSSLCKILGLKYIGKDLLINGFNNINSFKKNELILLLVQKKMMSNFCRK